ncbi:putative tetratricopeptide-like helical domain superfamily [Helianthus annuus]|nr:putative tetratricopeptide-like helical domain superfamily [Helianthus annuus]KAJ0617776.1 putative tetratricopeptide-like helical domain superfamily [Helianthus annuus]KAJ0950710.1 putative tetratricopeptide-like helical domain superfamily [Helianthus annuus]
MELHGFTSKMDFVSDPFVQTGLVAMYSACGHIEDARLMFDKSPERDIVAWNIMIDGYCVNGRYKNVLAFDEEMKRSNVQPDEKIFSTVVSACARARNLEFGKAFHEFITKNKVSIDYNLQCALVIMYAGYSKAGQIDAGRLIFDQMTEKDLICWSAMISGYAYGVQPQKALELFDKMLTSGVKPDQVTMLSVISACDSLGDVDNAIKIQ